MSSLINLFVCLTNFEFVAFIFMYINYDLLYHLCHLVGPFLTVIIFSATYTLQQLGSSLEKNEKLVTVCLARSNFASIHLPRRNTPVYGTHHLCVAILTTKHILT
jgi:hypothetical protein